MGKCVSKHPSAITIALSDKDLAGTAASYQIWSKFAASSEYIALRDEYGNQLCEYYYVSNKVGDDRTTTVAKQKKPTEQQNHQFVTKIASNDDQENVVSKSENENNITVAAPLLVSDVKIDADDDDATTTAEDDDSRDEYQPIWELREKQNKNKRCQKQQQEEDQHNIGKSIDLPEVWCRQRQEQQFLIEHNNIGDANNNNAVVNGKKASSSSSSISKQKMINCKQKQKLSSSSSKASKNKRKKSNLKNKHHKSSLSSITSDVAIEHLFDFESNPCQQIAVDENEDYRNSFDGTQRCFNFWYNEKMDDCENLVINLEDYEKLELKLQAQKQQLEQLTDDEEEDEEEEDEAETNEEEETAATESEEINENFIQTELTAVEAELESENMGQTESKKLFKKHGVGNSGGGVGTMETKGTAMSFGFRKKLLNSTPKKTKKQKEQDSCNKKQDKCNNAISGDSETATDNEEQKYGDKGVRSKTGGTMIDTTQSMETNDKNGNTDHMSTVLFEKVGAAVAAKTAAAQSHNSQGVSLIGEQQQTSHRPGAGNRFGFKGTSIVRPASTGITPRYQTDEQHANFENNNVSNGGANSGGMGNNNLPYKSNLKRRSKSAHSARSMTSNQSTCDQTELDGADADAATPKQSQSKTITFNLNHNTIEYQRRQFFQQTPPPAVATTITSTTSAGRSMATPYNIINTGMHTNVIVRPTPRPQPTTSVATAATTFTKFTLQTTSLPKPEYPVPIRLNTAAPSNAHAATLTTSASSSHATGARAKETSASAVASSAPTQTHHAHMDQKTAKQMANNTRRGFNGSREISADSGIASLDMQLGDSSTSSGGGIGGSRSSTRHASPTKRSRSRPRNLQMVMNGRHKFEVRDLDDPLSSENSSLVEPLSLPKLPAENQTVPLPLSGLVRSNTVLSREAFNKSNSGAAAAAAGMSATATSKRDECDSTSFTQPLTTLSRAQMSKQLSDDTDSIDEEKLHIDRSTSEKSSKKHHHFRDINTYSSKNSSAGSSRASSWCNAGESLAIKDCSSLSISSSEDSNKLEHKHSNNQRDNLPDSSNDDDLSTILNTDMQISSISSLTESLPAANALKNETLNVQPKFNHSLQPQKSGYSTMLTDNHKLERPQSLYSSMNESKFAEIAAAGSEFFLDDETSPTDSLVSSTDSDDAGCKKQKHKTNAEIQEKDIDEISPELEIGSPISPGTPTHASHSLSLSDCGNLIDDEIADQPALLFNNESAADGGGGGADGGGGGGASHKSHVTSDTPTLMEASSMRSLKSQSKARTALQQAIELSLRTPISLRKAVMKRAESLDTLSPCESICSDDLMMDFDTNSSMDSIDKSVSIKSRSGSDLHKLDDTTLFSELERKGSDVMKELSTLMRGHTRNSERESVIAHLPARATRLLNRSRLQQQCQLSNADSESPKSNHSIRRSTASRASTSSSLHHSSREVHSSSDDLMLYDKSFRNAMIQDVLQFKKQLLRLRRILQETETLNPFETDNGQLFASCGLDSKLLDDIDLASLTSSTTDDPLQELADLRRQVVYLQGQVDDRDRTIRLQKNLIEKLEAEKGKSIGIHTDNEKECINMATQTERTRPLSIGPDGLSRSKPEYTSYTTYFPHLNSSEAVSILQQQQKQPATTAAATSNQTRRHTIISTTFTNYNQQPQPQQSNTQRRASCIAWENQQQQPAITPATIAAYKPVKITLIGEPMKQMNGVEFKKNHLNDCKSNGQQQQNVANENVRNQRIGYGDYNKSNGYSKELPQNGLGKPQNAYYQQQYEKYQQHRVNLSNNHNNNNNSSKKSSSTKCIAQQQQPTVTIV